MRRLIVQSWVTPERADLPIGRSIDCRAAGLSDRFVAASDRNAFLVHYRRASHEERIRQLGFQRCRVIWREQFRRRPEVDDRRVQFACKLFDYGQVGCQEQRRHPRRREYSGGNCRCRVDQQLARELALADQDADAINSRPGRSRGLPPV